MSENKNKRGPLSDLIPLAIGEIFAAALVCLGFVIAELTGLYHTELYKVILGASLGVVIILANHLLLSLTVDREINKYLQLRGSREMSDEEAEEFTKRHSLAIQKAMALSNVIRTVCMLGVLVLAFITGWFNPIATAIPMFTLRPIMHAVELIKAKSNPKPDPAKFIKYEEPEEKEES